MLYIKSYFLIAFLLIILSYLIPNDSYQKYMKYFVGIIMSIMLLRPIASSISAIGKDVYIEEWAKIEAKINSFSYETKEDNWLEEYLREKAKQD